MARRLLLSVLWIGILPAFGQSPHPKAGDLAPIVGWTRILSAAGSGSQTPANLFGHITVLDFLPNVTANQDLVTRWNHLAEKFEDQPVQFVWITQEKPEPVTAWIKSHPVKGWLLFDSEGATARAYGVDGADTAIVDTNGKIAGFAFIVPEENQIQAVLDGRAVAISGDADDAQLDAVIAGGRVRLEAEPESTPKPKPQMKPDIPPSYDVHISPSRTRGTNSSSGPDFWVERGFDLKGIISEAYETKANRITLPAALDDGKRYDFVLAPPGEPDPETMHLLLQGGIEKYFQISVRKEKRPQDVYVMTALEGKTPQPKAESFGGFIDATSTTVALPDGTPPTPEALRKAAAESPDRASISDVSASGATIEDFRQVLEEGLQRPIIDETKLTGTYDLSVHASGSSREDFIHALRDQLGLVLAPAERTIDVLVVTSRDEAR